MSEKFERRTDVDDVPSHSQTAIRCDEVWVWEFQGIRLWGGVSAITFLLPTTTKIGRSKACLLID